MGQIESREKRHVHIRKVVDRVFEHFTAHSGKTTLDFHELYTAILLAYNDINKKFPGPHYDPPTREEVQETLRTFDTNENGHLDREEFGAFLDKFTAEVASGVGKNILIYTIAAPLIGLAVKSATEQLPRVGPVVRKIPNGIYATLITAVVAVVSHIDQPGSGSD